MDDHGLDRRRGRRCERGKEHSRHEARGSKPEINQAFHRRRLLQSWPIGQQREVGRKHLRERISPRERQRLLESPVLQPLLGGEPLDAGEGCDLVIAPRGAIDEARP